MATSKNVLAMNPLYNGVKVCSLVNRSIPYVRFGVVMQAGSRYENFREQGASHFLRVMHACSTEHSTIVEMTKRIEHAGAAFSAVNTRDSIIYWLECMSDKIEELAPLILQATLAPKLYAWEMEDCRKRVKLEVEMQKSSLSYMLSKLIHQSSFKGGLSNSLLISEDNIERLGHTKLIDYHHKNFTSDRLTLVGVGQMNRDFLANMGQQIQKSKSDSSESSMFYPRELRKEYPCNSTFVTFSFNACP
ncbi:hypothetical protein GJ496_009638 [Pomphorhynchus laevis]|nr:hypothetical protein GJ496_009638 [Pomphorhynchus laevis]